MSYLINLFPSLIRATGTTLALFAVTLLFSLPLGWLLSLVRVSKWKLPKKIIEGYCWVLRGTPLVLQLAFVVYFLLPLIFPDVRISRFVAACVAFVLNYSAYFAEIFRGGIVSVPKGQHEAAAVLGLSQAHIMLRIVLPQAIKTVIPSLGNEVITLVKDTSLVYSIGLAELSRVASQAVSRDFRFEPFLGAAIIYLALTFVLTKAMSLLEKKMNYYR